MHESYTRSIAKTATYRASVMATSFVVLWFISNVQTALAFTGLSLVYTTAIYFFHERAWSRVAWGTE